MSCNTTVAMAVMTVGADAAELVHPGEAAEYGVVAHMHVAGELGVVGEYGVVADLAVVGEMHVGHDPVVVAQARHAGVLRGAAVERAEFADGVAVADFQPRRLARVFLVLRHLAQRAELENPVVAADAGMAGDHHMRADPGAGADLDVLADDGIGADFDVVSQLGAGMDDGAGMDALYWSASVHISSASATSCIAHTRPCAANFHMPRMLRDFTLSISCRPA